MIGWTTPKVAIDLVISSMLSLSNFFRGCLGFGLISPMGMSSSLFPSAAAADEISTSRPLPSPLFATLHHFLRKLRVSPRALRRGLVEYDRFAESRRFGQAHGPRYDGGERHLRVLPAHLGLDLPGEV